MSDTAVAVIDTSQPTIVVDELVFDEANGKFDFYLLSEIRISRTNRKRFNATKMAELTKSVTANGVIQPILIRPVTPTEDEPQLYEIVAGERRYVASVSAGRLKIPAVCRVLTDWQAGEIQLIENVQREDVHPLEEAEGYERLMMNHGYDADQLATKVGKSRSYIYGRLKLCALTTDARDLFFADKVPASTALLIARIPVPSLQIKALKEVLRTDCTWTKEPMSYREAQDLLQKRYMLNLNDAPFSVMDAKLLSTAGSCEKCPKRTGNQPLIFEDVESADVCTDPDCFAEKRGANDARILAAAYKKGIPVIEGDEVLEKRKDQDAVGGIDGLWKFERRNPDTPNHKTIADVLTEKQLPTPTAVGKMKDGTVCTFYDKSAIQLALEKAGLCDTVEAHTARMNEKLAQPDNAAQREKNKAEADKRAALIIKAEAETAFRVTLYKQIREKAKCGLSIDSLRAFIKIIMLDGSRTYALPDDLLADVYPVDLSSDVKACEYIDQSSIEDIQLLLVDLVLGESLGVECWQLQDHGDDEEPDIGLTALLDIARHEGIDAEVVRQSLADESVEPIADEKSDMEDESKKVRELPHPSAWPFPETARP